MAFPQAYTDGLSARAVSVTLTFEIEGWPTVYANRAIDPSSWYSATGLGGETPRAAQNRPTAASQFLKSDVNGDPLDFGLSATTLDLLQSRASIGTATVSLVDVDGSLAAFTALRRPTGAVLEYGIDGRNPTDQTSMTLYLGGDTSQLSGADYFYVGRETFLRAGSIGGDGSVSVKRAQLGSSRCEHQGVFTADGSNGNSSITPSGSTGDVVSAWPRHLIDRKIWIRIGYNATCDADCVAVFVGSIRDFGWEDSCRTLTFHCEDAQARLKRPIFTDLATRWFPADSIRPASPRITSPASPGSTFILDGLSSQFAFAGSERFFGIVESQPFLFSYATTNPDGSSQVFQRGSSWFRASIDYPFDVGSTLGFRPMIFVAKGSADSLNDLYGIWPETVGGLDANHVLVALLLILTSTGTAADMATPGNNGDFDLLPATWGLGISQEDVDVAGILALAGKQAHRTVAVPVLDVVSDARDWLIALLRPFGYALTVNADGQLSVVSMDPLTPDDLLALPAISMADVALGADGQPLNLTGPASNGDQRTVAIQWSDSPFIRDGKLQLRQPITVQLSDDEDTIALNGSVEPLTVECPGIYSVEPDVDYSAQGFESLTGVSFFLAPGGPNGRTQMAELLTNLALRFGGAPFVVTMEAWLRQSERSVGDWVALTFPFAPNPFSAARGISNVVAQVTSRRTNLLRGTLDLELTISEAGNQAARFMSPAFVLDGWDGGSKTAALTDTYSADITRHDTDAVTDALVGSGVVVRVYATGSSAATSGRSGPVTVTARTTTSLTFSSAPTLTLLDGSTRPPVTGDVVRLGDYGEQTAAAKGRFAYLSDPSTDELGGSDPADTWA